MLSEFPRRLRGAGAATVSELALTTVARIKAQNARKSRFGWQRVSNVEGVEAAP